MPYGNAYHGWYHVTLCATSTTRGVPVFNRARTYQHSTCTGDGGHTTIQLLTVSLTISKPARKKHSVRLFAKTFAARFLSRIAFHMAMVWALIYLIWYWFIQEALNGWSVSCTVYIFVLVLSCTVFRLFCVLCPCVLLDEGDRRIFSLFVTDLLYV